MLHSYSSASFLLAGFKGHLTCDRDQAGTVSEKENIEYKQNYVPSIELRGAGKSQSFHIVKSEEFLPSTLKVWRAFYNIVRGEWLLNLFRKFPKPHIMARRLQLNIALESVVEHDVESGMYLIWYKGFPEAFAEGRTVEEAENNLIPALELMWKEHPADLKKRLLERYINDSHRNDATIVFD